MSPIKNMSETVAPLDVRSVFHIKSNKTLHSKSSNYDCDEVVKTSKEIEKLGVSERKIQKLYVKSLNSQG